MSLNFNYLLYLIYDAVLTLGQMVRDPDIYQWIGEKLNQIWWIFLFVSIPMILGIIYFFIKLEQNWREERERVYGKPQNIVAEVAEELAVASREKNQVWEKIVSLMASDNPNDWKQAIIEADKMLETVVNTFHVPGDNIGDKLKNIEKSDFLSLEEAWQAHKVRNQIAHEHNFHLSRRDARVALDNFEKVFREFDFI